ncbi:MAG: Verrucomicrobia phage [Planctomycetota bacterium]|jgi:predicted phosphodiesterase
MPQRNLGGDEITKIARRLAAEYPDAPARTLARRLVAECNGAITLEQARKRIMRQFGVSGELAREEVKAVAKRPPRQAGVQYAMPPSKAESWEPHDLGIVGTVGVLSDIHVPYHSEVALGASVDHLKAVHVDALVLNGDTADFYTISRWTKNPSKRDFRGELNAIRQLLAWLRGEFPAIPIVFKAGNHEERWNHWLWQHAPEISSEKEMGLAAWLHLDRHDIALVEDQRPIMAGKLPIMHGHEKGKGISAPVNQARGAFLRLHHTVLEGHGHRTSGHCEPDMWGSEVFCWSTGCLCDLRPEYARLNKWNHGFATVKVDADGQFDVTNYRIASGKVRSS